MKLSTRGDYGLRAMVYMAMRTTDEHDLFHADDISSTQDVPPQYLKQILSRLRGAGLVRSTRGPSGGHGLARPSSEITVGEVLDCLESEVSGVENVLAMPCSIAVGPSHCVIAEFLLQVKQRVDELLHSTTLADLAGRQEQLSEQKILVKPRMMERLEQARGSSEPESGGDDGAPRPESV